MNLQEHGQTYKEEEGGIVQSPLQAWKIKQQIKKIKIKKDKKHFHNKTEQTGIKFVENHHPYYISHHLVSDILNDGNDIFEHYLYKGDIMNAPRTNHFDSIYMPIGFSTPEVE